MGKISNRPLRRGIYAPLAARYYEDPAIARAGQEAELLYVRGLAYCAASGTDGYMSESSLRFVSAGLRNLERRLSRLCAEGLWVRDDRGGYQIRSWLKWNASQEDISAARAQDSSRKRKGVSARNPAGIRPETGRNPNGIRPPDTDTDTDTGNPPSAQRTDGGFPGGWRQPNAAAAAPPRDLLAQARAQAATAARKRREGAGDA